MALISLMPCGKSLEGREEPPPQAASEAATGSAPLPRLSRAELEQVRRLLDIGGISDLMDWARAIQARDPAFKDFSLQVQRLARLGDLAAIGTLCERMPVA